MVNFKNGETSINDTNLIKMQTDLKGTVLYENSEGISSGSFDVNISDCELLKFYDVDGKKIGECFTSAKNVDLFSIDQGSTSLYIYAARLTVSDGVMTFYSNKRNYFNGTTWVQDTSALIKLGKIIGCR